MSEPVLDLSEIIVLYKEDARRMVKEMLAALSRWEEVRQGGAARQELRRLSHQMRGSGRTYGFRDVTRICKAIENIVLKIEKSQLPPDDRAQQVIRKDVDRLARVFAA